MLICKIQVNGNIDWDIFAIENKIVSDAYASREENRSPENNVDFAFIDCMLWYSYNYCTAKEAD